VEGVGAVAVPVPPVEVMYHNKLLPAAVNGVAICPLHNCTGDVTVGLFGNG